MYAVVSNCPRAIFLGRYQTLEQAQKAIDGKSDIWLLYKLVED
jgi:hypothetical protein